jgi:hypothetical protein
MRRNEPAGLSRSIGCLIFEPNQWHRGVNSETDITLGWSVRKDFGTNWTSQRKQTRLSLKLNEKLSA